MASDGVLCLLRDEKDETWSVWLCSENRRRERINPFDLCSEAVEHAVAEEGRRS